MAYFALAAGHGASDPGATNGTRKEKNDNLKISLAVGEELEKRGHKVVQYRTTDAINCDYADCRRWLEKTKADFSIVFHRNSFSSASANGVEVWSFDADKKSSDIATALSTKIAAVSGMYNRGRKGNGAAWLSSNVLCCEPEIGFISNSGDNSKFDKSFTQIVNAVCDTLEDYFLKSIDITSNEFIAIGKTTNYLNIRKTPVNGAVLISMPTGSKCNIYSIENGWAKVSYNGYEGYSSADYLTIKYIKKEETAAPTTPTVSKTPEVSETPKKEEDKPSSETNSKDAAIEDKTVTETIAKNKEISNLPPQSSSDEEIKGGLDETVPAFIKLLKKIIEIIVKIWRK